MRNLFIIAVVVLSLVLVGLFIFIRQRTIDKSMEIHPTTSEISEILREIDPPFSNTDTLFLENAMKLCGDAEGSELPLPPQPEDHPFIEKLKSWAHSTASGTEGFNRIMDTIIIYSVADYKNAIYRSKRKKIYVLVNLEQSKKSAKFFSFEHYLYADTFRLIIRELKIDRGRIHI